MRGIVQCGQHGIPAVSPAQFAARVAANVILNLCDVEYAELDAGGPEQPPSRDLDGLPELGRA